MLAMADQHGRVWASIPGLANMARVTIEKCEEALATLSGPDKYSRTKEHDGRRVEEIDGGWRLLNHGKYRAIRDEESIKESKRRWAANNRATKKVEQSVEESRTESNAIERGRANTEAEAEAELKKEISTPSVSQSAKPPVQTEAVIQAYHDALPSLPRVRLASESRRKAVKKFWVWVLTSKKSDGTPRAETAEEALLWIASYFARAGQNDFLMGRTPRSVEHAGWTCDFDFLLTEKGMRQVIEKTKESA